MMDKGWWFFSSDSQHIHFMKSDSHYFVFGTKVSIWNSNGQNSKFILPETNLAPKNRGSQKVISLPTIHFQALLGTCPKAYRPTKRRINSLWPMGKVLCSRHHMIGIEYRICCGLAGLAFMCNNPFLFVFLFPWGQGWISDVFPHLFYVSLLRLLLLLFFFLVLLPRPPSSSSFVSFVVVLPSAQWQPATAMSSVSRQLRSSALSVPCRTSTATICTQCSLPDLDRDRNNFSHDRILSSFKRWLSGIALMFGPRAGLARPRGGLAGAR